MTSDAGDNSADHHDADHIAELNRVGDRIVFENERVRVWELSLEPGAESHVHEHPHDYLMICIEGDRIAAEASPGQDAPYGPAGDYVDIPTHPGHVVFVEGGVNENAINSGTKPYRNLVVELLQPASPKEESS